ncbi:MAG: hypothetical protein A3G28_03085 [Betaproteobacteria bacterium RIFCSPLOWO2_12_FULL_68_19]|nr:MAG: hypothetical protein A3G28_03085 [Betaproteobacteria bacterium RIFCSPLOWO2_12_FULL_68_19]
MRAMLLLLALLGLPAGCAVHIDSDSHAATILGVGIIAAGMYSYETQRESAPELAPDRTVSEQDCTRPVDLTLGNLRCK